MDESPVSASAAGLRPSESPMREGSSGSTSATMSALTKSNTDHDNEEGRSAEERLQALQVRTEQWKATVAAQLREAARKNKQLREELGAARTQRAQDLAALRLELHNEFKERTQQQQESVKALNERIAQLQEEQVALQQRHDAASAELERRVRQECAAETAARVAAEVAQERQSVEEAKAALQAMEQRAGAALQAERQRCAERDALAERYQELVSLFSTSPGEDNHNNNSNSEEGEKAVQKQEEEEGEDDDVGTASERGVSSLQHARYLATLRARLTQQSARLQEQLAMAAQDWQGERQRLMHEVHVRDEQLVVVQTLLQQAQTERRNYEQRMHDAQHYKQEVEQSVQGRVTSLERQLSALRGQLSAAEQDNTTLQQRLREEQERVRGLIEEAQTREEAIAALMQSEESKVVVYTLERTLQATREELEQYKLRCAASEAHMSASYSAASEGLTTTTFTATTTTQDSRASPTNNTTRISAAATAHSNVSSGDDVQDKTAVGSASPTASAAAAQHNGSSEAGAEHPMLHNGDDDDDDGRAAELSAREARLASREAQLASKEALLQSVEAKLEETKRSLAAHVTALQLNGQISPLRAHNTSSEGGAHRVTEGCSPAGGNDEDEVFGRAHTAPHRTRGKALYTLLQQLGSQVLRRRPWRWPMRGAGFSSYTAGTATTMGRPELRTRLSGSLRSMFATRRAMLVAATMAFVLLVFVVNAWQAAAYNQAVQQPTSMATMTTVVQSMQA